MFGHIEPHYRHLITGETQGEYLMVDVLRKMTVARTKWGTWTADWNSRLELVGRAIDFWENMVA